MTGLEFALFAVLAVVVGLCLFAYLQQEAATERGEHDPPADFSDPTFVDGLRGVIQTKAIRSGPADTKRSVL